MTDKPLNIGEPRFSTEGKPELGPIGDAQEREEYTDTCECSVMDVPHVHVKTKGEDYRGNPGTIWVPTPVPLPKSEAVKDHHDILRMVRELAADVERDHYVRQVAGSAENLIDALAKLLNITRGMWEHAESECEALREEVERLMLAEQAERNGCVALRAENERLGTDIALQESLAHGYTDEIAELSEKNERLKEALTHIEMPIDIGGPWEDEMKILARAALERKP